jgi:hypothetical protein
MKQLPHRRNFTPDSPSSIPAFSAEKFGAHKRNTLGMKSRLFGDIFDGIQGGRMFADDPSIAAYLATNPGTNNESDLPIIRHRPQHPWYHLSPKQSICLIILLLLLLLIIIFTAAVKRLRKKRLEMAQKYGKDMKKNVTREKQVDGSGDAEHNLDASIANVLITPMHTPTASVDKISIRGDNDKHIKV